LKKYKKKFLIVSVLKLPDPDPYMRANNIRIQIDPDPQHCFKSFMTGVIDLIMDKKGGLNIKISTFMSLDTRVADSQSKR